MLKNTSLTFRIAAGFAAVLLAMMLLIWQFYQSQQSNLSDQQALVNIESTKIRLSARMVQNLIAMRRAEKNLILSLSQDEMDRFVDILNKEDLELNQRLTELQRLVDEEGRQILSNFTSVYKQLRIWQIRIIDKTRENGNVKARELSQGDAREIYDQALPLLQSISDTYTQRADQLEEKLLSITNQKNSDIRQAALKKAIARQRNITAQIKLVQIISRNLVAIQRAEKNIILSKDPDEMQSYNTAAIRKFTEIDNKISQLQDQLFLEEGDDKLRRLINQFRQLTDTYEQTYSRVVELSLQNSNKNAFEFSAGPARDLASQANDLLTSLTDKVDRDMDLTLKQTTDRQQHNTSRVFTLGIVTLLIALLIAYTIIRNQKLRIANLTRKAQQISVGLLPDEQTSSASDELSEIDQSLDLITRNLREIIETTQTFATGDFNHQLTPRSDNDPLISALNQFAASSLSVIKQSREIAEGNYEMEFMPRSSADELGIAMQQMGKSLRQSKTDTETREWLDKGISLINKAVIGAENKAVMAHSLITSLCEYTQAKLGSIYIRKTQKTPDGGMEQVLNPIAGYGLETHVGQKQVIHWGQTLVGQSAADAKFIELDQLPETYIKIVSGLGESRPQYLLICPFTYSGQVLGVIELASIAPLDKNSRHLLELAMEPIGIAFDAAARSEDLAISLENSRTLSAELQQQQEELEETNQQLESQTDELEKQAHELSQQRTELETNNSELQRSQLELKQRADQLIQSSRYKSEFLANMSHELRTPLNSIMLLSSMLADGDSKGIDDESRDQCRIIKEAGTDLLRLINEVLDLAKIESGKVSMNWKTTLVSSFQKPMQDIFTPLAAKKQLQLEFASEIDPNQSIRTDADRVLQVLRNFLSNALKFTHNGSVSVRFYYPEASLKSAIIEDGSFNDRFASNPQGYLAIDVKDTGIGIPADKRQQVFEAFQQSDGSISREYGGTGLGLSISMQLAEKLGGSIALVTEENKGSTFTLLLPLKQAHQESESVTAAVTAVERPELPELPTAPTNDDRNQVHLGEDSVLLIVEDDANFAKTLMQLAHDHHYKVIHTATGSDAIHLAERYQPSGILLDIKLPVMDGWQVLQQLKRNESTRHIPVHVLSVSEDNSFSLRLGAVEHLTKPVSPEKINEVLDNIEEFAKTPVRQLLIIEDDEIQAQAIAKLLCDEDVECTIALTGKDALEKLYSQKFHACIVDLKLPDMTGQELIRKIGTDPEIPALPILVYTGRELSIEQEQELREFADSIILKTVDSAERLLEETSIFLHRMTERMSQDKQKILRQLGGNEKVLEGKTVLCVDDDVRNTFALKAMLQNKGIKVLTAINGQKALTSLEENPQIDIVLMDIMMPVMDGYTAMREIRKQPRYEKLPIIALTAKAMTGDRQECLNAGASDYMSKPLDYNQLLSLLRVWLSAQH